jgi:ATPase subunit of ABC transporter with duplicated ATPase domains
MAEDIVESQLSHLDDTDAYAAAWSEALERDGRKVHWGGKGQGGRGLARRTFQPRDVSVAGVRLEYVGHSGMPPVLLLDNATLKLSAGHVYGVVGKTACGKSTLLRRIHAGKVAGFPPHINTLYIAQEEEAYDEGMTPLSYTLHRQQTHSVKSQRATECHVALLESEMNGLDLTSDEDQIRLQELADVISALEEEAVSANSLHTHQAEEALRFMGVKDDGMRLPLCSLSEGIRRKVTLSLAVLCPADLVLLDEPTNSLDILGLLRLRQLVQNLKRNQRTVMVVSHDLDFLNDVCSNVIEFDDRRAPPNLSYYAGNYADYYRQKVHIVKHDAKQAVILEKKREAMFHTLHHLKQQSTPRRGGAKKKARQVASHRKKMNRFLVPQDTKGPRQQPSISTPTGCNGPPDRAIQFVFRSVKSWWGEPLIMAMDVGYGYNIQLSNSAKQWNIQDSPPSPEPETEIPSITAREGFLFDCVDLCIQENCIYCIVGDNASGKSTLLKILARRTPPFEGKVIHAQNVEVALLDQEQINNMATEEPVSCNALSYLMHRFPSKMEQEIRGELTAFGLSPKQAKTELRYLSGGERYRLCLAASMLHDPHVLMLDHPTNHLDVESVDALAYGLKRWNGTIVMASHDTNFVRSVEAQCYALVATEGKLRRVEGGIDAYLRSFGAKIRY